jgi:hypothetical protein
LHKITKHDTAPRLSNILWDFGSVYASSPYSPSLKVGVLGWGICNGTEKRIVKWLISVAKKRWSIYLGVPVLGHAAGSRPN